MVDRLSVPEIRNLRKEFEKGVVMNNDGNRKCDMRICTNMYRKDQLNKVREKRRISVQLDFLRITQEKYLVDEWQIMRNFSERTFNEIREVFCRKDMN